MNQTVSGIAKEDRDPRFFYWRGIPYTTTQEVPQSGVVLVDKPKGWSSHDVVNFFRRRTGVRRIGHAGTLDPLATGLLIVLIGRESTKLQSTYLKQDKTYEVEMQLGITTDTYDSTGTVTATASPESILAITRDQFEKVLHTFIGEQQQRVPMYSAVKVSGQKLYAHAREQLQNNEETTLEPPTKKVKIIFATLKNWQTNNETANFSATLEVKCSSGTYIRSLVHDIGQAIGVGATVTALKRKSVGVLSLADPSCIYIKEVKS